MINEKWLITGGCGFVGSALVNQLLKSENISIVLMDNLSVGEKKNINCEVREIRPDFTGNLWSNRVSLITADILEINDYVKHINGVDYFVHLAANTGVPQSIKNPSNDFEINVLGTFRCLEAAKELNAKRFIFASSGAPVGNQKMPINESSPLSPVSPYGASKMCGEGYCSAYFNSFGLNTVVLRFSNVFGPGSSSKDSVVAKFFKDALNQREITINGDGTQIRDFLYIDDLVAAIVACTGTDGVGGETFQIASGKPVAINTLASVVCNVFEFETNQKINIKNVNERFGDVAENYSDISKANSVLNWRPCVDIRAGIEKTCCYFVNSYNKFL